MIKSELAKERFDSGYACSQAIITCFCNEYDLNEADALKLSAGFAAGMQISETCGVITGAIMVLGIATCGEDCNNRDGRSKLYERINEFCEEFKRQNEFFDCSSLLGCDLSTEEGRQIAVNNNLFNMKCSSFVESGARILEGMLVNK
ncbi:MAG: C_GCAxxG_C_C family protein [Gammaproteobacteria bacterium]|nr:MAG: C_GCAxxG_C_C family protein [Gammaproteobacteria bacterium]